MNKQRIKFLMFGISTIICGLLTSGGFAKAQSDSEATGQKAPESRSSCSNRTLHGDYGSVAEGVLIHNPGLPPEAQFRSVGMAHFDGRGSLTWVEHTVINGKPINSDWLAASGTYSVNANCTGTAVVDTPNSPVPLNLNFVVVRQGQEVHTVLDAHAIATTFTRVE
jgi:hypothetical protein